MATQRPIVKDVLEIKKILELMHANAYIGRNVLRSAFEHSTDPLIVEYKETLTEDVEGVIKFLISGSHIVSVGEDQMQLTRQGKVIANSPMFEEFPDAEEASPPSGQMISYDGERIERMDFLLLRSVLIIVDRYCYVSKNDTEVLLGRGDFPIMYSSETRKIIDDFATAMYIRRRFQDNYMFLGRGFMLIKAPRFDEPSSHTPIPSSDSSRSSSVERSPKKVKKGSKTKPRGRKSN